MSEFYTIRNCVMAVDCKADWEKLEDTGEEKVRYCHACHRQVFFCENDQELTAAVKANRCVAFERPIELHKGMLLGQVLRIK